MPNPIHETGRNLSSAPSDDYVLVTKADADLPNGPCRALLVATSGTANLTTLGGEDRDGVPLMQGYNSLACSQVRLGGTADGIWALY